MRRWGQVELLSFDPDPEKTLHQLRREQREASKGNLAVMQIQEGQDQEQEKNDSQGDKMGIMVGTMLPGRLYSQMIRLCC